MHPIPPIIPLMQEPEANAWYTTRGDCDAESPYDGFNVCHYTGDSPSHVTECRLALAKAIMTDIDRIVIPRQTHSSNVLTITALPVEEKHLEGVDALVTNLAEVAIGVNTADCVPVVLIDSKSKVIGIVHAGWRGAMAGIVSATVSEMSWIGSSPTDIKAAMGPSICAGCFEVGEEVAAHFSDHFVNRNCSQKPHVSLHRHITHELIACGLQPGNITPFDDNLCTRHNCDRYWSARALGINSGRMFTFVKLR